MPSFKQSMNIDMRKVQSIPAHASGGAPAPAPVETQTSGRSHFIDSSLPVLASGSDVYTRQFYNRVGGLPQRRFFPARGF